MPAKISLWILWLPLVKLIESFSDGTGQCQSLLVTGPGQRVLSYTFRGCLCWALVCTGKTKLHIKAGFYPHQIWRQSVRVPRHSKIHVCLLPPASCWLGSVTERACPVSSLMRAEWALNSSLEKQKGHFMSSYHQNRMQGRHWISLLPFLLFEH